MTEGWSSRALVSGPSPPQNDCPVSTIFVYSYGAEISIGLVSPDAVDNSIPAGAWSGRPLDLVRRGPCPGPHAPEGPSQTFSGATGMCPPGALPLHRAPNIHTHTPTGCSFPNSPGLLSGSTGAFLPVHPPPSELLLEIPQPKDPQGGQLRGGGRGWTALGPWAGVSTLPAHHGQHGTPRLSGLSVGEENIF